MGTYTAGISGHLIADYDKRVCAESMASITFTVNPLFPPLLKQQHLVWGASKNIVMGLASSFNEITIAPYPRSYT